MSNNDDRTNTNRLEYGGRAIQHIQRGEELNTYKYTFQTACPNDGEEITYKLVIESEQMIMAEEIVKVCGHSEGYQEYIASVIKEKIGGLVTLKGTHSGVKITTVL